MQEVKPTQFPSQWDAEGVSDFDRQEKLLRGHALQLHCTLPSGEVVSLEVFAGQDVAFGKSLLAKQLDLEYSQIQFYLQDKLMFDPLSFVDFAELANQPEANITVKLVDFFSCVFQILLKVCASPIHK